jgi:hypothetical protein
MAQPVLMPTRPSTRSVSVSKAREFRHPMLNITACSGGGLGGGGIGGAAAAPPPARPIEPRHTFSYVLLCAL